MINILCYGDSNTYGFDPRGFWGDRYDETVRWCDLLAQRTGWQITNSGLNGRTIPRSQRELDMLDYTVRNASYTLLILLLGTNDILQGGSPEAAGRNMNALVCHCKSCFPDLPLLLVCPPPARLPDLALSRRLCALAPLWRELAQAQKIPCLLLPNLPLAFDGIHLSEAGHRRLAEILVSYLCTYFNQGDLMP